MVYLRDDGGVFDAPIDLVWEFVGSGDGHSRAHRHRATTRRRDAEGHGTYSWEQEFLGRPELFTMRWHALPPLGIAYEVLAGPFEGSRFFLYYTPMGERTGVTLVGDWVSPTLPESEVPAAVDRFFALEFEQDGTAVRDLARQRAKPGDVGGGRSVGAPP